MPTYNHLFTIAFTVCRSAYADADDSVLGEREAVRAALRARCEEILETWDTGGFEALSGIDTYTEVRDSYDEKELVVYTYNQNCTLAGEICHNPRTYLTDDNEISGDVTEWRGTREQLIADFSPIAERETGRPDFLQTIAQNILTHLDWEEV